MSACEPVHLVAHGLADVVEQRRALRRLHARLELGGHDAAQVDDLERVLEDVLPVARAVAEAAQRAHELLVELAAVRLEHRLLAGLHDVLLELGLRLVVHLLDPRGMDAAVLDQAVERHARDFAAQRVERREHDGVRSVVDDEVDAREVLERADVPALAADDSALEVVRSELHHRHGRLGRVARRDALERVGDERARPAARVRTRLFLHLPHLAGELVADEVLRAFEQLLARLVDGQARDLLERREGVALRLAELLLQRLDVHLAIAEPLLLPLELGQPGVGLVLLLQHTLLDLGDLDTAVLHLALDLAAQRDGLLARFDLRLAANGLGLAASVVEEALALCPGCAAPATATTATRPTDAATAPMAIPMSTAPAESIEPPGEDVVVRGLARGCSHPAR